MGRGKLRDEEVRILRNNPFVVDVCEHHAVYSNEFKHIFMEEYKKGKSSTQIFREAGFDPKILGTKRIERAAARWRESYESGTLGLYMAQIKHKKT